MTYWPEAFTFVVMYPIKRRQYLAHDMEASADPNKAETWRAESPQSHIEECSTHHFSASATID
jgi:hypothetical protein